ncbi:MAG: hypothetical protein ACYCZR_03480, partial [Burkholderiales bacterium]
LSQPVKVDQSPGDIDYLKRKSLSRIPETPMNGEAAVEWGKEKLAQMVPEAISILQWDMRHGTDRVRSDAAQKVMAANGLDKREAANTRSTPTIVVNIGTGDSKAPWLERLKKTEDK